MSTLLRALRSLARTPGFSVVSVLALALAIASIGTLFGRHCPRRAAPVEALRHN